MCENINEVKIFKKYVKRIYKVVAKNNKNMKN